ncbi:hypothetical protein BRYFOR_08773 [Marvinbryantia formatexigens DSM 14469]|uniref:Uncharacterized protein n=1 Tax=Marvinbryantia formatexigens DSM 14469 TaxID=478749 RepID=C6LJD7_9FIRM|nr:hypothetical protein BRYFOR_08773 [Marvinbryantia formatexigens DSM 14469]
MIIPGGISETWKQSFDEDIQSCWQGSLLKLEKQKQQGKIKDENIEKG